VGNGTGVVTSRIPLQIIEALRNEAESKNLTLSAQFNKVLRDHVAFHSLSPSAGFIPFSRRAIQEIMNEIPDETLTRIARNTANSDIPSIIYLLRSNFNLESSLDVLKTWCNVSNLPYRESYEDGKMTIVIQHDVGNKFSLFLKEKLMAIVELLKTKAEIRISQDILIITIHVRQS
jgi:hypothetical protein